MQDQDTTARTFGRRYRVLNTLGAGGWGTIHRVVDRVAGHVATLKSPHRPEGWSDAQLVPLREALEAEYVFLSGLRHPHIVRVLDFGRTDGWPYFTMDLQEHAIPIVQAGRGQPLAVQVDLAMQLLRALAFVHDQGLLHRDIKPDNVLVTQGTVTLLDFGMATPASKALESEGALTGSLAWMAPEVLSGRSSSPVTDLYGVGLLLLAMCTQRIPFEPSDRAFPQSVLDGVRIDALPEVPAVLRDPLARLIAPRPKDRFPDARAALDALSRVTTPPLPLDTVATREAQLASATLVGRASLLATLDRHLDDVLDGETRVVLVAGKSGMGKSRLAEEMAHRARLRNVDVATGRALAEVPDAFGLWRDPARLLALSAAAPSSLPAPLHRLVEPSRMPRTREEADEDAAGAATSTSDVCMAFDALLTPEGAPALLILEDLQWAAAASMELLRWVATGTTTRPVLVLATYRSDEAPDIPERVGCRHEVAVGPLTPEDVATLCAGVCGEPLPAPLSAWVHAQSDGIPFFVFEALRALADAAGGVKQIARVQAPGTSPTPGWVALTGQRVRRLAPRDVHVLETAALAGLELDLDLLATLHPGVDVDAWCGRAGDAGVLTRVNDRWRFEHDKLREVLAAQTDPTRAIGLHRRLAQALEDRTHKDRHTTLRLVHHWHEAGDLTREAEAARAAGLRALEHGATEDALPLLARARSLAAEAPRTPRAPWSLVPTAACRPSDEALDLATLEQGLALAHYRLGDLERSRDHARRVMALLGLAVPTTMAGKVALTAAGLARYGLQTLGRLRAPEDERTAAICREASGAHRLLTEAAFYAHEALDVTWSTLENIGLVTPHGDSALLAEAEVLLGLMFGLSPLGDLGRRLRERGLALARSLGHRRLVGRMESRNGVFFQGKAQWAQAIDHVGRATAIAEQTSDRRLLEECHTQLSLSALFQARCHEAQHHAEVGLQLAEHSQNRQAKAWSLLLLGSVAARCGRLDEAASCLADAEPHLLVGFSRTESLWLHGLMSQVQLERGHHDAALSHARRALDASSGRAPVAYWSQPGVAAMAVTVLRLAHAHPGTLEAERRATRTALWTYAAVFDHGKPAWALYRGLEAGLHGPTQRAEHALSHAIAVADAKGMPYEGLVARRELEVLFPDRVGSWGPWRQPMQAMGGTSVRMQPILRSPGV